MTLPTTADFNNAKRDLDDLAEIIGSSESKDIVHRSGHKTPTITKVINSFSDYSPFRNRGGWLPSEQYLVNDIWQASSGVWYVAMVPYVSASTESEDVNSANVFVHQVNIATDSVRDLAELRTFNPQAADSQINCLKHGVGAGGGGRFFYNANDTVSSDDNGYTIVTNTGKRLTRIVDQLTSEMFGVVGDGVVDDTAAIQNQINAVISRGETKVYLREGSIFNVTVLNNTKLVEFHSHRSTFNTVAYQIEVDQAFGKIELPADFSWFPKDIFLGLNGAYSSFDILKYRKTGKTYFVRHTGGNDANDGLTFNTAFSTMVHAFSQMDVDVIFLQPGEYFASQGAWGFDEGPTRDVTIRVLGGARATLLGSDAPLTGWSLVSPGVYSNSASSIKRAFDRSFVDKDGNWSDLDDVDSIAEVQETPGSFYTDNSTVYVHLFDGRVPDADVMLQIGIRPYIRGDISVYMENINCYFGFGLFVTHLNPVPGAKLYANNCEFKYSADTSGSSCHGGSAYYVDCVASKNGGDGFGYSSDSGFGVKGFELNSIGFSNGAQKVKGVGNSNGSTAHGLDCNVIRLNCKYSENLGPNCIDVLGSNSFNVNVEAFNSRRNSLSQDFTISGGDMYLVNCLPHGSQRGVFTTGGGRVYHYKTTLDAFYGSDPSSAIQFNPFK